MIDYINFDLYNQSSIKKELFIYYDDSVITNDDLYVESFSIDQGINPDNDLIIGSFKASVVKFKRRNDNNNLQNKEITIKQVLNRDYDNPFNFGKYKVYSDKVSGDRNYRDVIAYDSLYDVVNAEVSTWYNSLEFPLTLKGFRDSFFDYIGIEQVETELCNDSMMIHKSIETNKLSGKDVLFAICEINGAWGFIDYEGRFKYVTLSVKLDRDPVYPAIDLYPAEDLFPVDDTNTSYKVKIPSIINCNYEDYTVEYITKLSIKENDDDAGVSYGEDGNEYVILNNFLYYGNEDSGEEIAKNIFDTVSNIAYAVGSTNCVCNPCVELGDNISIHSRNYTVNTFVFNRRISGIQALRDNIVSYGSEKKSKDVNNQLSQIKQVNGKMNILSRTVEETLSKIEDLDEKVSTEIKQLSDSVAIRVNEDGNVTTDLSLDKNGMSFSGDKIVIDTTYFKLDENGKLTATEGSFSGSVTTDNYLGVKYNNGISKFKYAIDTAMYVTWYRYNSQTSSIDTIIGGGTQNSMFSLLDSSDNITDLSLRHFYCSDIDSANSIHTVDLSTKTLAVGDRIDVQGPINNVYHRLDYGISKSNWMSSFRDLIDVPAGSSFIAPIRTNTANIAGLPIYGAGFSVGTLDTQLYLSTSYATPIAYIGGGNGKVINWYRELAFHENTCVIKSGSYSNAGIGAWKEYSISFGVTYRDIPAVFANPTTLYSNENIVITDISKTGCKIRVYEPSTSFTYGLQWFAIGNT